MQAANFEFVIDVKTARDFVPWRFSDAAARPREWFRHRSSYFFASLPIQAAVRGAG
jgi:hypothetical protein